jgi:GNAT superfamily N-acetyltransferase
MAISIIQLPKKEFSKIKTLNAKLYLSISSLDKLLKTDKKTLEASFKQQKKGFGKHKGVIFIALDNSNIIGYTYGIIEKNKFYKENIGQIWELFVDKKYRNKGVGKDLIKHILIWFKKQNLRYVGIGALYSNPSTKLYKRLGFTEKRVSFIKRLK